jgi:hypothetical protein
MIAARRARSARTRFRCPYGTVRSVACKPARILALWLARA